jgi:ribonuclease HII
LAKGKNLPTVEQEALLWKQGSAFVFGVDEAGRGCLAGPVCAGAACWAPFSTALGLPAEVRDSKMMTEHQREAAFPPVQALALSYGVGFATAQEIDRWNILRATHLAIARAVEASLASLHERGLLNPSRLASFAFLIDGNQPMVTQSGFFVRQKEYADEFPFFSRVLKTKYPEICVVKGDSKVFTIASASVLAKVSRDRLMTALDAAHPAYAFAQHKGYSTPSHIEKLRAHGPCSEHRQSFSPVSEALQLFS